MDYQAAIIYAFILSILIGFAIKYKWPVCEIKRDWQLIFSKSGRLLLKRERCHLHVYLTFAIDVLTVAGLFWLGKYYPVQIETMPPHAFIFLGTFYSFLLNFGREGFMQHKGGYWKDVQGVRHNYVPFSWRDVRFGTYTGFVSFSAMAVMILIFT